MTVFILTEIKENWQVKTLGVFKKLFSAEELAKYKINEFNINYPEHTIAFYSCTDHAERKLDSNSENETINCKTIWYKNNKGHNQNTIYKIEEVQVE